MWWKFAICRRDHRLSTGCKVSEARGLTCFEITSDVAQRYSLRDLSFCRLAIHPTDKKATGSVEMKSKTQDVANIWLRVLEEITVG